MKHRRGHGEGSIQQLPNRRWRGWLTLPDGRRVSRQARTKGELLQWMNETRASVAQGIMPTQPTAILVRDWLDYWLETKAHSIEPKTYHIYEVTIRLHIVPELGHLRLHDIRADQIQRLYNDKAEQPRTAENCHRVLRMALSLALEQELIARNPLRGVIPPRYVRPEMKSWTADEAKRFLESVDDARWAALYWLLLTTGMRPSEALALRWGDIDLDAQRLQVRRHLVRVPKGGGIRIGDTKTHSARVVGLTEPASAALARWRKRQDEERSQAGAAWRDEDFVFTTATGSPLEPRNVNRDFDGRVRRLGLRDIRPYDLRHTCATLLLQQGVPLKVVSEILGHASTAITGDIYAHATEHMQAQAQKALNHLFSG